MDFQGDTASRQRGANSCDHTLSIPSESGRLHVAGIWGHPPAFGCKTRESEPASEWEPVVALAA